MLAFGVWCCSRVIPVTQDDAYIFFRYAENIARGFGPVFNRGGPAVEGFTSPIWTGLLAAAARVLGGDNLPAIATMLGLLCYCGCLIMLVICGRGSGTHRLAGLLLAGLLPAALWGLTRGAVYYAVTGLETDLFVLVVLVFHGALAGAVPLWLGMAAAGCAVWVRPEGPWLVVAGAVQVLFLSDRVRGTRQWVRLTAAVTIGALLLLATRWHIFHDILPNTYYAKRAGFGAGLSYLQNWFHSLSIIAVTLAGVCGAVFGTRRERGWFAVGMAWLLAVVLEGGDWMPYARFLQPALALFALAAAGLARVATGGVLRALAVVASCALFLRPGIRDAISAGDFARSYLAYFAAEGASFQKWVKGTHVRSLALIDIGQIGYVLPEVSILDLDGLTDTRLGHMPGGELSKPLDLHYVFDEQRPEMIVVRLGKPPETDAQGEPQIDPILALSLPEGMLLGSPRLARDYRLVFVQTPVALRENFYARAIYVRRDVQLPPEAVPSLRIGFFKDVSDRNADNTGNGPPVP